MSGTAFKVVIPARYASTRLPGKPLLDIAGKPMIEHTYQRAVESGAEQVLIATDDERVCDAARAFGAEVCMTSASHETGTDRIGEVARQYGWLPETIVVNVQGDEPLIDPALIRQVAMDLAEHEKAAIATIGTSIHHARDLFDPNVVKLALDNQGYALYFSRAPIPWDRDAFHSGTDELPEDSRHYRHIGLYAYREEFLGHYSMMEPCYLEKTEALEQLRALANGVSIHVSITELPPGHGVDTPDDLERVREILARKTGAR